MEKNNNLHWIGKKYDPENDVPIAGPPVTWAEKALYDAIKALATRVGRLEANNEMAADWIPANAIVGMTIGDFDDDDEMDAKASALEMAQSLKLDDAIRTVAKSGLSTIGPDWYAEWGGMGFSVTFGARTNSATVRVISNDVATNHLLLYHAADFGRHIETFRYGPWVHRIIDHAGVLCQANEAQAKIDEVAKAETDDAKFKEVDF